MLLIFAKNILEKILVLESCNCSEIPIAGVSINFLVRFTRSSSNFDSSNFLGVEGKLESHWFF